MCNGNHKFKHMEVGPRYISLNAKPGKLRDDVIYSKKYLGVCRLLLRMFLNIEK